MRRLCQDGHFSEDDALERHDMKKCWQGGFTALSVPSLSYTSLPKGYENGKAVRNGKATRDMDPLPSRENLEEAQGYFVTVYDDRIEVERRETADANDEFGVAQRPVGDLRGA